MRLLCLLLSAVSASAADMDFDAPGFWSKTYAIPRTYCERSISVETPRVEKLIKAAAPCEFRLRGGGARSDCRLPGSEAQRIVAELRRLGTLTSYSQTCDASPELPELYYKRDNLLREWNEFADKDAVPSIGGLLDAQFAALDRLISTHEAALESTLTIVITGPEASPPPGDAANDGPPRFKEKIARKRAAKAATLHGAVPTSQSWARRSRAVCDQIEAVTVVYEKTGDSDDAKRLGTARRLGTAYIDPTCGWLNDATPGAALFSVLPEAKIRKILMELPGLRSWTVGPISGNDGVVPDDRRFDMLSAELLAQKEILSRAPHIRGLAAAEVERVRENAELLRKLRKGRLLLIRFR